MAITPDKFLECAEQLVEHDQEIDVRSACSRAYYAAYHMALNKARELNFDQHDDCHGGLHLRLRKQYERSGLKGAKQVAELLAKLHRARVSADYKLLDPCSKNEVRVHIGLVKKTIERLNALEP